MASANGRAFSCARFATTIAARTCGWQRAARWRKLRRTCATIVPMKAVVLAGYLEEVCRRLDGNPRQVMRFAQWCESLPAIATGVALIAPGCGGTVESTTELSTVPSAEVCTDNIDNDRDGRIDCGDPDCKTTQSCIVEICGDQLDNDGNGKTDCEDVACFYEACGEYAPMYGAPLGRERECEDGKDGDGDGLIDCADGDCAAAEHCSG